MTVILYVKGSVPLIKLNKMKNIFFIVSSLLLINLHFLSAQDNSSHTKKGKIGITFSSFGENNVVRFVELTGDAAYDRDYFYTLGMIYIYPFNKWLEGETGIEYSKHHIVIRPNVPPDMDNSPRKENFSLINVPVTLRVNFLKYLIVNAGLFFDFSRMSDTPIDNQTGLGTLLGLSLKYDFNTGISAFVNPYTKLHSLIPFNPGQYHQRVWENGIRIGLSYDLGRMK